MFHGLPVVAARAGGTVDVVEDGKTGILVPPESPGQLASAVSGLLLLPDERARMGAAGRQRVEEQYLFPQFAARWQQWMARVAPEAIYLARHAKVFAGKVVEAHKV
jgi:glycosyltransferase involved in cell wall biosynthesis